MRRLPKWKPSVAFCGHTQPTYRCAYKMTQYVSTYVHLSAYICMYYVYKRDWHTWLLRAAQTAQDMRIETEHTLIAFIK